MSDTTILAAAPSGAAVVAPAARGPWANAWHKLRRDRAAMVAATVLVLIALACIAAPIYATQVSGFDPFASNLDAMLNIDGADVAVMQPDEGGLGLNPVAPTWRAQYFLGGDGQGRDVAARLLYGGRSSLIIASGATVLTLGLAGLLGIVAGFFGGAVDTLLSRFLDILWAFPIYLLAISLSIVLINQSIDIGPFSFDSGSLMFPILIIGIIYVPYVARPIRGVVLGLARGDFVLASRALGVPPSRILVRDILPNVMTTLIVFAPLMMALNMLTESALSFLSIGVQPPNASWGTIIEDGQNLIYTRPLVAIAPGLCIVFTVLALNVLGDGVRDALDPRAKLRVGDK